MARSYATDGRRMHVHMSVKPSKTDQTRDCFEIAMVATCVAQRSSANQRFSIGNVIQIEVKLDPFIYSVVISS
jgi:hypothetical protein